MSNEQLRYVLDHHEDFLDDEDIARYTPEGDKPNFQDWNPPSGHTEGTTKTALKGPEVQPLPGVNYPPHGIVKGSPAHRQWKELMSSENFKNALKGKPAPIQWAIAHHAHTLKCRKHKVKPFSWWTPEHKEKFETKLKGIHNNLRHKAKFKAKTGESPEQFRRRVGKCPKHFVWVPEKNRCVHKDSVVH